MDQSFAQLLDEWTAYYALMGGVAATLLGLLFIAVSLRLNIFRRREVADVRDFAAFSVGTFLVALAIAGLALAPHEERAPLAMALFIMGLAGFLAMILIARVSWALNRPSAPEAETGARHRLDGWGLIVLMCGVYLGLAAVAVLLGRGHPAALGWLAVVEAGLLAVGAIAAWTLLSHAGSSPDDG